MTDFSDCINYIDRVKIEFHNRFQYLLQSLARLESQLNASSAGRKQTGAAPLSPPSKRDSGSRHHTKKQKGSHSVMPSGTKSGSNPSVSPYPPVRYEWEEWE